MAAFSWHLLSHSLLRNICRWYSIITFPTNERVKKKGISVRKKMLCKIRYVYISKSCVKESIIDISVVVNPMITIAHMEQLFLVAFRYAEAVMFCHWEV
jgi:hypothetical protein